MISSIYQSIYQHSHGRPNQSFQIQRHPQKLHTTSDIHGVQHWPVAITTATLCTSHGIFCDATIIELMRLTENATALEAACQDVH